MVNSKVNSNTYKVDHDAHNKLKGTVNAEEFEFMIKSEEDKNYCIIKDDVEYDVDVISTDLNKKSVKIIVNGMTFDINIEDEFDALVKRLGFRNKVNNSEKLVKALMPGLIIGVHVVEGEIVSKGQKLLTLEAMKMENVIKASDDLKIKKTNFKKGDTVEKNDILFELE